MCLRIGSNTERGGMSVKECKYPRSSGFNTKAVKFIAGGGFRFLTLLSLILALVLPVIAMPTFAAVILGNSGVGSSLDSGSSNSLNGSKINVGPTGVNLTSIGVRVGSVDTSPNNRYQLAVYTNNNGVPGTLVAQSASGTLVPNDWNTLPVSATLQPNTSYWLMYNTNGRTSAVNNMYYNNGITGQGAYASSASQFRNLAGDLSGRKADQGGLLALCDRHRLCA